MDEQLIPLNILIGDRSYRIRINATDEEAVRRTVKTINDKIVEYKTNFAGKDMQDYIAMVLAWYATSQTGSTRAEIQDDEMTSQLAALEKMIEKAIGTNE
jgi:cell division protein ZapA (FtsZ GTPase activity inhibitor)